MEGLGIWCPSASLDGRCAGGFLPHLFSGMAWGVPGGGAGAPQLPPSQNPVSLLNGVCSDTPSLTPLSRASHPCPAQDYATILFTCFVIVGIVVPSAIATPRQSEYWAYDASISKAGKGDFKASVPDWVPVIIPLIYLATTIIVGEIISSKAQHNTATEAVACVIFFFLDGVQSFIFGLLVTQVTKFVVGRPRPDFLARCNPANTQEDAIIIGGDPSEVWPCQSPWSGTLKSGWESFPSGHTSTVFNTTVYCAAYLIWCWHMRLPWKPMQLNMKQQFLLDLRNVAAKVWMLILLAFAW